MFLHYNILFLIDPLYMLLDLGSRLADLTSNFYVLPFLLILLGFCVFGILCFYIYCIVVPRV
jgi:hypothetical protein